MVELFAPGFVEDPWPTYAELRADAPVHRDPRGFWVLTRHADCLELLRSRAASSDARNIDPAAMPEGLGGRPAPAERDEALAAAVAESQPFLFRDPPEHTVMRGLVAKAFTPRMVEGLRDRIEALVADLLDGLCRRGEADMVAEFAYPLPIAVICEMLGIPRQDWDRFSSWSAALARGLDPDFLQPPGAAEERLGVLVSFAEYFLPLLDERRRRPADDLLSALVAAEDEGRVLEPGQVIVTAIFLLVAGHETTVNLISGGVLALIEHPDQAERWRRDPAISQPAVEELLRFVSPVQLTGRALLSGLTLGGTTIPAGHFVMAMLGSANRDPEAFVRPDSLDLGRPDNRHLGFGFGIHHCLGAPLARLEAAIALRRLLERTEALELTTAERRYRDAVVLRGLAELPVRLRAR